MLTVEEDFSSISNIFASTLNTHKIDKWHAWRFLQGIEPNPHILIFSILRKMYIMMITLTLANPRHYLTDILFIYPSEDIFMLLAVAAQGKGINSNHILSSDGLRSLGLLASLSDRIRVSSKSLQGHARIGTKLLVKSSERKQKKSTR